MPKDLATRISYFYCASALSGAFSGLLAAAIAKMDGVGGYEGWRWIFLLEGIVTVALGVSCFFLLIDSPALSGRPAFNKAVSPPLREIVENPRLTAPSSPTGACTCKHTSCSAYRRVHTVRTTWSKEEYSLTGIQERSLPCPPSRRVWDSTTPMLNS